MELDIKFNENMLVEMANRVLDEYEYNGKTIREWADLIANPKTNADRLRAKSDEKLAIWIFTHRWNDCSSLLDWLKQEAEEGEYARSPN